MNRLALFASACAMLALGTVGAFAQGHPSGNRGHERPHGPTAGARPHFAPNGGRRHSQFFRHRNRIAPFATYLYPYGFYLPPTAGYYAPSNYDYANYEPQSAAAQDYAYPAPEPPPPPSYYESRPLALASPPPSPPPPAPQPPPPAAHPDRYTLTARELFEFDRDELRSPEAKLGEIAAVLIGNPQIGNININGYADRLESDTSKRALSQRRADVLKAYLVSKGVPANRLNAIGRGTADSLVQCPDDAREELIKCLAPNRRVEIEQFTVERSH